MSNNDKPAKKENFHVPLEVSSIPYDRTPNDCEEMVNAYGTYNIHPTNLNDNDFPAIAQGLPKDMERSLEFFRGPEDENPAKPY